MEGTLETVTQKASALLSLERRLYIAYTVICTHTSGNADVSVLHSSRLAM